MGKTPTISIELMDKNFQLLSLKESQKIIKGSNIKCYLVEKILLIPVNQLKPLKENLTSRYFLLDDEGTELTNTDIEKIISDNKLNIGKED